MAQVSSSGIVSGLDINSIVKQLVAVERRPIDAAQRRQSAITAKISAFTSVDVSFRSFKTALIPLQTFRSFQAKSASSSDTAVVTASVTDSLSAITGVSTINQVVALARAHKLESGTFTSSTAVVGTGTLKIKVGSAVETAIAIGGNDAKLTQIKDKINAANAGVIASVRKSNDKEYKLILQSSQSGTENTISVEVIDDDANNLDVAGLSKLRYTPTFSPPDNITNLTEIQSTQDAQFLLDGSTLTRSSNTISDAIDGVTITLLKKTAADAEVSVNVVSNTSAVKGNIESFVAAYNEVIKGLNAFQAFDSKTQRAAPLLGNTTAQTISNTFRLLPRGTVPDLDGPFVSLFDIGIISQRDGTFTVDSSKLNTALAKDPLAVGRVFALFDEKVDPTVVTPTSGIADQLLNAVSELLNTQTGRLPSAGRGLKDASALIDKEVARLETRVADFEKKTREKFAKLEGVLSRIQGVGSALSRQITQLENLTSFIARRNSASSFNSSGI